MGNRKWVPIVSKPLLSYWTFPVMFSHQSFPSLVLPIHGPAPWSAFLQRRCAVTRKVCLGFVFFQCTTPCMALLFYHKPPKPQEQPGWEHTQDSFARTKPCKECLKKRWPYLREGELWRGMATAALFPYSMDIQTEEVFFPMQMCE